MLTVCPAFGKSLYWHALNVAAHLDADDRMTVREQQVRVFDGPWNGGERRFNLRQGQTLRVLGITRMENGRPIPLTRGNLSFVDDWDFVGPDTIRWRSRMPNDPPFDHRQITYVIDYELSNILDQLPDGRVRLQHDFAFPDRDGVIEAFGLNFTVDPVWQGIKSPVALVRRNLQPGKSVFVSADLTYTGTGKPSGVHVPPTRAQMLILPLIMLLAGATLTG